MIVNILMVVEEEVFQTNNNRLEKIKTGNKNVLWSAKNALINFICVCVALLMLSLFKIKRLFFPELLEWNNLKHFPITDFLQQLFLLASLLL